MNNINHILPSKEVNIHVIEIKWPINAKAIYVLPYEYSTISTIKWIEDKLSTNINILWNLSKYFYKINRYLSIC